MTVRVTERLFASKSGRNTYVVRLIGMGLDLGSTRHASSIGSRNARRSASCSVLSLEPRLRERAGPEFAGESLAISSASSDTLLTRRMLRWSTRLDTTNSPQPWPISRAESSTFGFDESLQSQPPHEVSGPASARVRRRITPVDLQLDVVDAGSCRPPGGPSL